MKENIGTHYGEFLLRFLNVAINVNEINWREVEEAYEKYQQDKLLEAKEKPIDLFRPGLVYINWVISNYFNADPWLVREGKSRKRELTKPRQIGHYIAVTLYKFTLQQTGTFYNKDHATVLHSRRTVQNEIDTNKEYRIEVLNIIDKLKNGNSNERTSTERSIGEIQIAS